MLEQLKKDLEKLASPEKAEVLQRFFKTRPGEYGEGDVFLGVKVPEQRAVARKYKEISHQNIQKLMESEVHEHRLTGLLILVDRYQRKPEERRQIFDFYLNSIPNINNWDLVDLSAPNIVGSFILENPKEKKVLYRLARGSLWARRIAVLATFTFIRKNQFKETLELSELLLKDEHDLIHKAVGWMLREIGKRDQAVEERFLNKFHKKMPRTMLRYTIERFPKEKKKFYMKK